MQEETVPQNKKFLNQKIDKQTQINMKIISETSLDKGILASASEEEKIQIIIRLKSIHLEWLNIKTIQNLQVFQQLNVLYLQHNLIKRIQGLDHLVNLEYLALNNNKIEKITGIKTLKKLLGLNLNNNFIEDFDPKQLPENIQLLSLINNPVCMDNDYKQKVLKRLKFLETLDDKVITPTERFKLLGLLPEKLVSYSNQMKQFYTKKQLKAKLQQQTKPILLNSQNINEKQALNEIREKTRKFLYQNQQTFKTELKSQVQNFNERIQVSKKIRNIKESEQKERINRINEIKSNTINQLMQNYKEQ